MHVKQTYLLIERLDVVKNCIQTGFYPSSSGIIQEILDQLGVEVSVPTVYRDIEFLRDRGGLNIKFDRSRKGYYIARRNK